MLLPTDILPRPSFPPKRHLSLAQCYFMGIDSMAQTYWLLVFSFRARSLSWFEKKAGRQLAPLPGEATGLFKYEEESPKPDVDRACHQPSS